MKKILSSFLLLLVATGAFAQGLISGKVTDDSGDAVIGATVYYEGTDIRAVTDVDGKYSIKSVPDKTLVFSCFGLKDARVEPGNRTNIDVNMVSDALSLDDAVVIGYGSQQRQDLTGSVASVKADEIRKANQYDVLGSLQGRVAGLNITTQSGEPGSGYSIRIRGNNSINASTTPLIVVDGIQMDINPDEGATSSMSLGTADPLAFLNPVDIQSVEVLKDASATAIYGARGAGGVILITTKSGAENAGKTAVTLDVNFGLTTPSRGIEMLDAQDWLNYRFENAFLHMDRRQRSYFGVDTDGDGIEDTAKDFHVFGRPEANWQKTMLRNAFSQQYNLSFRTSVGKGTKIIASVGYLNQQGMIVNNGYDKFTAKMKVDHEINRKLKVGANVNFSRSKSKGAATSSGGSFSGYGMTQLIFLEKPVDKFYDESDPNSNYLSLTSLYDCISEETSRTGVANKLMGNAYLEWKIIPDLTFKAFASGDLSYATNNEFFSERTRWGHFYNGVATVSSNSSTGVTANATFTYRHSWKKKHNFEALAGAELNDYGFTSYSQQAEDFEDDSLRDQVLAKGKLINPVQRHNSNARVSGFGRINYNYDWRYYVTANMRCDASSKFAKGSRVGFFPSVSVAWRISNEPWMLDIKHKWMDNFKIRLSAGSSGNDRIDNYAFMSTMDAVYYSDGTGKELMGMAAYSDGNPSLKWETTYQFDAGIDLTLFKGRVDFVFDAYDKETMDMLFLATVPSQSGYTNQWQNIGQVRNRGLEFTLNTVNIKRKEFSWSTSFTLDLNRNKVISLGEGVDMKPNNIAKGSFREEPTRLMVGQPIGIIWGYVWDGNYQLDDFDIYFRNTDISVDKSLVSTWNYNDFDYVLKDGVTKMGTVNVMPGDRKLKDLSGDGVIMEADDKTIIGKCDPDFTYGIGNTFTWRGLSLYLFFDGVYGKDILNEFKYNIVPGGTTSYNNITKDAYYNSWRPENGSNKHASIMNQNNTQSPLSSYFVEDGSFFRFKTLSISYSLPSSALRAIRMDGLKFSLSCNNVYTWTNYSGLDPDMSSRNASFPGIDRMGYPTGRTWSFGIIANF